MKRLLAFVSAFLLSVSSMSLLFTGHAFAVTKTWDGGGGDNNLMTDANWVGDAKPTANVGDDLIFPYGASVSRKTLVNDYPDGSSFSSIVFTGTPSSESDYTISGNSIAISYGLSVTSSSGSPSPTVSNNLVFSSDTSLNAGGNSLVLDGVISGAGNITKDGFGTIYLEGVNTFTGTLDVNAGNLTASSSTALGSASAGTSINDTADLTINTCSTILTVAEPLTLSGDSSDTTGDFPTPKLLTSSGVCSGGGSDENYGFKANTNNVTLSGDLTLGSDVTFASLSKTTLTGNLTGSFDINLVAGYSGQLVVNGATNSTTTANGTYSPAVFSKTLSDSQPSSSVYINDNAAITITGTRGDITIDGGTLKGTGTVGAIDMSDGALAPGMSPGVLSSGSLTFTGGAHQVELGGTASGDFDQIDVTGSVTLGSATTLSASLYNSFKPVVGNSFIIINNDGADAVSGTFDGLAEGASFKVSGYTFKVSYVGGTGNDVVITVTALPPKAPDTGVAFMRQNPLLSMVMLIVVAPGLALAARRSYRFSGKL